MNFYAHSNEPLYHVRKDCPVLLVLGEECREISHEMIVSEDRKECACVALARMREEWDKINEGERNE